MNILILLQFAVVIAAIYFGSRTGGVGLGLWGGVGLFVLSFGFGLQPTSPPIDVMLIILAVVMAAAVMEAAGGIDYLVGVAEKIIRSNPKYIVIVAPLVCYIFTLGAGTGHVFYPLLPIIFQVAYENNIRPERAMAISTIASQQAITASPVSAAMIVLYEPLGFGLAKIMLICIPATMAGVMMASIIQTRIGKDLKNDPEYQKRLAEGTVPKLEELQKERKARTLPKGAQISAWMFLTGVVLIVLAGLFPSLRPSFGVEGKQIPLNMALTIQIIMLTLAALILLITKTSALKIPATNVAQAGLTAAIGIFGLAWLGDTFIKGNEKVLIGGIGQFATTYPFTFAIGLFFASVLLFSQAATTRALMPLGISLGLPSASLIAMWPAVNGYFFLPTYGSLIAAMNFDRSGTTRIGKFILNHSFMIPGLVATITAVMVGLGIASFIF